MYAFVHYTGAYIGAKATYWKETSSRPQLGTCIAEISTLCLDDPQGTYKYDKLFQNLFLPHFRGTCIGLRFR